MGLERFAEGECDAESFGLPVRFPTPLTLAGQFAFKVVRSPYNSLRTLGGLLGMVGRAGSGDTVLVEQLFEYTY